MEKYKTNRTAKNAIDIYLFGIDKMKYRNYSLDTAGYNKILIGDRINGKSIWINTEQETKREIKTKILTWING